MVVGMKEENPEERERGMKMEASRGWPSSLALGSAAKSCRFWLVFQMGGRTLIRLVHSLEVLGNGLYNSHAGFLPVNFERTEDSPQFLFFLLLKIQVSKYRELLFLGC